MKAIAFLGALTVCVAIALMSLPLSDTGGDQPATTASATPYDPYPPGILPTNLEAETTRVQDEIRLLFNRTLETARALPPVTVAANPPTQQGTGYEATQLLGALMNFDLSMSPLKNEACASCHMPYAGYSGPIPSVNLTMIAYPGSYHDRANKRTAMRYAYSPYFPQLQYDATDAAMIGGNFWDGRATGYLLQSPDAEQAQHPPVDAGEMGFPDTACIAFRLSHAVYRPLFERVWGTGSLDFHWPAKTRQICATPGRAAIFNGTETPIPLSPVDRTRANDVYDHWAQSLSAFEHSPFVSPFTSKFDAYLAGKYQLTADEKAGYALFRGRGNCNSCHLDGTSTLLKPDQVDSGTPADDDPLFTCFGYANEGVPLNPAIALFYETKPDRVGYTPNPYGFGYRDLGLGNFLRSGFGAAPNPNAQWISLAPVSDGQFQVASLRDVALTPKQCPTTEAPGPYFQKEFFHNGYFKSLKQILHFYNTRDVYSYHVTSGHCPKGTVERVTCWPMPEVPNNIDMTTGNLGLTDHEENLIVTFLETLTDGYTKPYPYADTYTGQCMVGGSAATQGNASLILTPKLPTCAAAVCDKAPLPGPHPIPPVTQASLQGLRSNAPSEDDPGLATLLVPAPWTAHPQIVQAPTLEVAHSDMAIIRWTSSNPGGSDQHFAMVHYGTAPTSLDHMAASPVRLNRAHATTIFRVRIEGLRPSTTYYYLVSSVGGDETPDALQGDVSGSFTTPPPPIVADPQP
jgi:cytochrome c peroxidase